MSVSMYLLPSITQHNILTQCVHVAVCVQIKTIVSTTKIRFGHLTLHPKAQSVWLLPSSRSGGRCPGTLHRSLSSNLFQMSCILNDERATGVRRPDPKLKEGLGWER